MTLVDIEKLEYETFMAEDGEIVDYISAEALYKAPKVDPVNHAEWVREVREFQYTRKGDIYINHVCSNCGNKVAPNAFSSGAWEAYEKDHYNPELPNYCSDCGYKMDLRELYEQYKRDWCLARGYELIDTEIEECGINGECYACFTEWYNNEYLATRGE